MADVSLTDGVAGAEELAKARIEDEGFSPAEKPDGEDAEDRTQDAALVTAEQWTNAQGLIRKLTKENIELGGLLRRYQAKYGQLED